MEKKPNHKLTSNECTEMEMDLTDYVMGDMAFLTKEKQQRLFKHLLECEQCRKDFFEWEDVFGLMVTEQHLAKPEVKKRMEELLEQFHKEAKRSKTNITPDKNLMI
jgi:protein involved in temperature-dependent protein secretion